MNYRILFVIAFLILIVGVVGIFYVIPDDAPPAEQAVAQAPQPEPAPVVNTKTVLLAKVTEDFAKGQILRSQDFTLSEESVPETDAVGKNDLSGLLVEGRSLEGFTVSQNLAKGSYITPNIAVAPDDERFMFYTLDPKNEVAYQLCIEQKDASSLDTLQAGENVGVYVFVPEERANVKFSPLFNAVKLLQLKKTPVDEENPNANASCAFTVRLKLTLDQVKKMYAIKLPDQLPNRFLLLPAESEQPAQRHGTLIRSLRGN